MKIRFRDKYPLTHKRLMAWIERLLTMRRPRNISEADWRMALRRKLNGDTR